MKKQSAEKLTKKKDSKKKKLKILAAGDIHGDVGLVKKLAKRAKKENVDVVILTGDITFAEQSTDNLIGPFMKANKQVLLLHGNHESIATIDFLAEMYSPTKNLHGYSFKRGDVGIFGAGGADIGIHHVSDSEVFNLLKKGYEEVKNARRKIMVTHMHAKGTKSDFFGWEGSKGIRKAVEKFKPDFLLHSHIHEAEGIEEKIGKTKIINVGKRGKIIEV